MLSRNIHNQSGNIFPTSWQEEISQLFHSTYKTHCDLEKKEFNVYGVSYPNELLIIASYLNKNHPTLSPTTIFTSMDIQENFNHKKAESTLIDIIGLFFDDYFSTENWDDYLSAWQKFENKNFQIYYKITRENIELTLAANKLLGTY